MNDLHADSVQFLTDSYLKAATIPKQTITGMGSKFQAISKHSRYLWQLSSVWGSHSKKKSSFLYLFVCVFVLSIFIYLCWMKKLNKGFNRLSLEIGGEYTVKKMGQFDSLDESSGISHIDLIFWFERINKVLIILLRIGLKFGKLKYWSWSLKDFLITRFITFTI